MFSKPRLTWTGRQAKKKDKEREKEKEKESKCKDRQIYTLTTLDK